MNDLLVGIGLVLVIEGLLWALIPRFAYRMLEAAARSSEASLRISGMVAVAAGVLIVWLVRG
ncbi:MAG: hypothetical protein RLZ98_908 [Pseudomonadota bacterium]|jgi:uncharacterized protein YjeT (DUF2065 family)